MGVTSCGKSTIGAALGERLKLSFLDGDTLHPASNIEKMSKGVPLTDEDRWPWLEAVGEAFANRQIIACSALKRSYRDCIRAKAGGDVLFIHLEGTRDLLAKRMLARKGHFMPPALLDSQLATLEPLEPDENHIVVSIDASTDTIIETIATQMKAAP
ncbi:gluconokinase [Pseudahrensia aquimaris]|uniref:Gluconokinase n=1 Tax=Pseudahrensia aquimaris TaxID=744461 RepID=A0ABW3FFC6_9HYPH